MESHTNKLATAILDKPNLRAVTFSDPEDRNSPRNITFLRQVAINLDDLIKFRAGEIPKVDWQRRDGIPTMASYNKVIGSLLTVEAFWQEVEESPEGYVVALAYLEIKADPDDLVATVTHCNGVVGLWDREIVGKGVIIYEPHYLPGPKAKVFQCEELPPLMYRLAFGCNHKYVGFGTQRATKDCMARAMSFVRDAEKKLGKGWVPPMIRPPRENPQDQAERGKNFFSMTVYRGRLGVESTYFHKV